MRWPLWLPNLKEFASGTTIGSKNSMDVNVANTASIPVNISSLTFKEYRTQDAADTAIPASGGTAVQVGDTAHPIAVIANTCTEMRLANNTGSALIIYKGANSGALTAIGVCNQGQTSEAVFGVSLVAGDKIWVRAVENTAVSAGIFMVTLTG